MSLVARLSVVLITLGVALTSCLLTGCKQQRAYRTQAQHLLSLDGQNGGAEDASPIPQGLPDQFIVSQTPPRSISVHKSGSTSSQSNQGLYFHTPLLTLATTDQPISGYSPIVFRVNPDADGVRTRVFIRVLLSSGDLREHIKAWTSEHDADIHSTHVDVHLWPLMALRVTVKQLNDDTPLATALVQMNRPGDVDYVDIAIPFQPERLSEFKANIRDVYFLFSYSFDNETDTYARTSDSLATEVNAVWASALESAQLSPDQQITQQEHDTLISKITSSIQITVEANDKELATALLNSASKDSVLNSYLPSKQVDFASLGDEDLRKKLYDHLTPLLQTAHQQWTQSHTETDTSGIKVSAGLGLGPLTISPEASDQIQKTTGISFQRDNTTQVYSPYKATVYTVKAASQATTAQFAQSMVVAGPSNENFLADGPIPIALTADKLDINLKQSAAMPFDGVLPGMAFCYMGKIIPEGFFELNGTGSWPNAAWVPDALRGQKTVAAQGKIVGIASNSADVGMISAAGKLPIPSDWLPPIVSTSVISVSPDPNRLKRIDPNGGGDDNPFDRGEDMTPGTPDWNKYAGNISWNGTALSMYRTGSYNAYPPDHIAQPYVATVVSLSTLASTEAKTMWPVPSSANPPSLQCRWIVRN